MGKKFFLHILILLPAFIFSISGNPTFAQINGALFIKPDNFYTQIYNPACFRTDGVTSFTIAGFGGASVINQGNFKIGDVITLNENNDPRVDFNNFYENSKVENYIRQNLTLPVLFVSLPFKKGMASFYYNENITGYSMIRQEALAFLSNGNLPADYRNFNSEEIKLAGTGYREFAFGYGKPVNYDLNLGVRAKILFGAAQADTRNWNYLVRTSALGDTITLSAGGTGRMMIPLPLNLREDNSILSVNTDKAFSKYLGEYSNPGFSVDVGFTFQKDKRHYFSGALRDLGFIRFKSKSYDIKQDDSFQFIGFDLVNAIRYPEEGNMNSTDLVRIIKEEIRDVYQPYVTPRKYFYMMPVKTVLHYHYQVSNRYIFGGTSQMSFGKNSFYSVLTLSALQDWPNFSVFENLNVHDLNDISLGGGIRYEGTHAEVFAATDNLLALYHPAANKSISLTFGICFLLNHKKEVNEKTFSTGKGKISPYLPFYREKK